MTTECEPSQRHFIMPIFVPHMGCPHQCVFCNQTSITGANPNMSSDSITQMINDISEKVALHRTKYVLNHQLSTKRAKPFRREIAFYGGSFTGMEKEVQMRLLCAVQPLIRKRLFDAIRISTRPDSINPQTLDLLKRYGVLTVELGVQSMVNEVLRCSRRGHTVDDVLKATELLHSYRFEVGIQIMVGLPGDDARKNGQTVDRVIQINPHFVRIYPTLVLKGTVLEKWYRSGRYRPLSLQDALDLSKRILLKFTRAGIPVIRIGLQSSPELETEDCIVAGPYHPAFGHLVESSLFYDMASYLMEKHGGDENIRLKVSPFDISNIRGQKNRNLHQLKERFGFNDLQIEADEGQPRGSLILINGKKLDEMSYQTLPLS